MTHSTIQRNRRVPLPSYPLCPHLCLSLSLSLSSSRLKRQQFQCSPLEGKREKKSSSFLPTLHRRKDAFMAPSPVLSLTTITLTGVDWMDGWMEGIRLPQGPFIDQYSRTRIIGFSSLGRRIQFFLPIILVFPLNRAALSVP